MVTMVPGSRYVCSTHAREGDSTNDREERILAVLGIIGTILNLLVVIFVYIYTTVT
ncbi:protein TUNAR-like [Nerophis ophidion]|uniref:protein TUNAR-like n=1 Tax=Nerophis ophidion TaxID=159077 RepID=UPI002ADF86B5|nr:protein TUNAR-like [Nerophis ophidion]XP_061924635.1 protein TUNAR-like [Entelurus aequoreus]XP_061924636.1 protein TUNAR-like [Entelurus aequoreus]XP_061924637.1 protein TUNAR-like [Entelurus aequoreus]